jgi:c-di-GMP-binding flagellar brake protein YcgR
MRDSMPQSGQRRRVVRVRADLRVVIATSKGDKHAGRVRDLGIGGMHVECDAIPAYGETVTVIAQLNHRSDWMLLPGTVRWFTRGGVGVEFAELDDQQATALARYVDHAAA